MRATRITANLRVPDLDAAKSSYTDYLGLSTEEFNLRWVAPVHLSGHRGGRPARHPRRDTGRAPDGTVINVVGHRDRGTHLELAGAPVALRQGDPLPRGVADRLDQLRHAAQQGVAVAAAQVVDQLAQVVLEERDPVPGMRLRTGGRRRRGRRLRAAELVA